MNKRKLTKAEKRARKRRRAETMIVFWNGREVRVPRPPKRDSDPDEFIRRNADPIWLVQNEMWEFLPTGSEEDGEGEAEDIY